MTAVERFLESVSPCTNAKINAKTAIQMLAVNKDIRIFLTALCKYSPDQWTCFIRNCKLVVSLLQSSVLIKGDADIIDDFQKVPHIAAFFRRLTED